MMMQIRRMRTNPTTVLKKSPYCSTTKRVRQSNEVKTNPPSVVMSRKISLNRFMV